MVKIGPVSLFSRRPNLGGKIHQVVSVSAARQVVQSGLAGASAQLLALAELELELRLGRLRLLEAALPLVGERRERESRRERRPLV